ncbi:response regulator [Pseudomonadales bacterium]|nr:response regulator [Pseudomonadales bacterium]
MIINENPTDNKVAIVAETDELLTEVLHHLNECFESIEPILIGKNAVSKLEEFQPHIIIFFCHKVSAAEAFYLTLHRTCNGFSSWMHESIILCAREEAKKCYQLCIDNVFNDFCLFKPVYEPFSLRLTVTQAIERRKAHLERAGQRNEFKNIDQEFKSIEKELDKTVNKIESISKKDWQMAPFFTRFIKQKVDGFQQSIISDPQENGIEVVNENKIKDSFDRLKSDVTSSEDIKSQEEIQNDAVLAVQDELAKIIADISTQRRQLGETSTSLKEACELDKTHILLIDNDIKSIKMIREALKSDNYVVTIVPGPQQGRDVLDKLSIDVILVDTQPSDMQGAKFLQDIQSSKLHGHIPIVIISRANGRQSVQHGLRLGASDYIIKPFEKQLIEKRISRLLEAS